MIAEHVIEHMENEMRRILNYADRIRLGYIDECWRPFEIALQCKEAIQIMRKHNEIDAAEAQDRASKRRSGTLPSEK